MIYSNIVFINHYCHEILKFIEIVVHVQKAFIKNVYGKKSYWIKTFK